MIIYKLTNKINGMSYIGQTVNSLKNRINEHIWTVKNGFKLHLYNAIRKYGFDNFKSEILDTCNDIDELNEMEIYYIKKFDMFLNGYNLTEGGGGTSGCVFSEESKRKMSEARKGKPRPEETKLKMSLAQKGKKHSEKTKLKMSEARKGKKHTKETKLKMSLVQKKYYETHDSSNKGQNWILTDPKGKKLCVKNLKKWCRKNKLKYQNFLYMANGIQTYYKEWQCERI